MGWFLALLAVTALQRLLELLWSRRRLRAMARSRAEVGLPPAPRAGDAGDWSAMVLLHVALLVAPGVEALLRGHTGPRATSLLAFLVWVFAQGLRYWSLKALGAAWNARGVVDASRQAVTGGPYAWVRHPNYLAVVLEFVALPLAGGAWISLVVLNLLHIPVLARRIRQEEVLLAEVPGWREAMAERGRLLPRPAAFSSWRRDPRRGARGPRRGDS